MRLVSSIVESLVDAAHAGARAVLEFLAASSPDLPWMWREYDRGHTVRAALWQHPVGQGFFHSGTIEFLERLPFRYVYDCGRYRSPAPYWDTVIGPTVTEYHSRPLEALFVSHLDSDHINGLSALLAGFDGSDRAFLPYLHPVRRLVVAMQEDALGGELSDEYVAFIDDPAGWLLARGVRQVVFVGGGYGDGEPRGPIPPDVPGGDSDPTEERFGPASVVVRDEAQPLPGMDVVKGDAHTGARFMDHRYPVVVYAGRASEVAWVLQTYVEPDAEMNKAVHACVRESLGPVTYDALVAGRARCGELLRDATVRRRLARSYQSATKARGPVRWRDMVLPGAKSRRADRSRMNRSTLSLFSGPILARNARWPSDLGGHLQWFTGDAAGVRDLRHVRTPGHTRTGWLLTGDAVLRDADVLGRFVEFFSDSRMQYLSRTLVFTTPHHGSQSNFSAEALRRLGVPPVAVVPAGNGEHFGHPSEVVLRLIRDHGVRIVHVRNHRGIGLRHHLYA